MGLDIRTNGVSGIPTYAVQDGYIERITAGFSGYGKALYLVTKDGYRVVYGHLDRFSPTMESVLKNRQVKEKSYTVRMQFKPGEFPVAKGALIGYGGNTGHSFAPHLHFELRDTSDIVLNPQLHGFEIPDKLSPIIEQLTVIPCAADSRINGGKLAQTFPAYRDISGVYHLPDTINCSGEIGFSLKVHDRASGSPYKYNVRKIKLTIDGQTYFNVCFDTLLFHQENLVKIVEDHHLQRLLDEDYHKLYHLPALPPVSVHNDPKTGLVNLLPGPHELEISVTDNAGNISQLKGRILVLPAIKIAVNPHSQSNTDLTFEIVPSGTSIPIKQVTCYSFTPYGYADQKIEPVALKHTDNGILFTAPKNLVKNRILQFIAKNKMGVYAEPYHWDELVNAQHPLDLGVNLELAHGETGVFIQVETSQYTDLTPTVRVQGLFADRPVALTRIQPNTYLSDLLDPNKFNGIDKITVTFYSQPEREFCFPFQGTVTRSGKSQAVITADRLCSMQSLPNSFYDTTMIWIEPVDQPVLPETGELLSKVYQLQPFDLPLQDSVRVAIRYDDDQAALDRKALYFFDRKKGWQYLPTHHRQDRNMLIAPLTSLEAVAILRDTIPPEIITHYPGNGGHYHYQDVQTITVTIDDNLAGIAASTDNLLLLLDGELLLFAYQPIKKIMSYCLGVPLDAGAHELVVSVTDQVGNATTKLIKFTVN